MKRPSGDLLEKRIVNQQKILAHDSLNGYTVTQYLDKFTHKEDSCLL